MLLSSWLIGERPARESPSRAQAVQKNGAECHAVALPDVLSIIFETDPYLRDRASELGSEANPHRHFSLPFAELARVVSDTLRLAFAHSDVRRVTIYGAQQPSCDRLTVAAEHNR